MSLPGGIRTRYRAIRPVRQRHGRAQCVECERYIRRRDRRRARQAHQAAGAAPEQRGAPPAPAVRCGLQAKGLRDSKNEADSSMLLWAKCLVEGEMMVALN